MKVLLDENFPLALLRSLTEDGAEVEHIIAMGWRGASDQRIREDLLGPDVLFLTQDEDFLFGESVAATIVVSRVRQSRRLGERVAIWRRTIREMVAAPGPARRFELMDDGQLLPWAGGNGT